MNVTQDLLKWFDKNRRRHLPWREDPSPYHVWISEIMLQQTRVEAVLGYYRRFMDRLPHLQDLAEVAEEELLKLWEGLGYYSRAKNLKKAAIQVQAEYQGCLPGEKKELLKLPGIGPYTAGAISSIAFGHPEIAPDGNAYRVMARLFQEEGILQETATKKRLEKHLQDWLPDDRPGDFNQALMDLGALVCIPNGQPYCDRCPFFTACLARQTGIARELPHRKKKKQRRIEKWTLLLFLKEGRLLLERRPEKGLLSGLWGLPMWEGRPGEATLRRTFQIMKDPSGGEPLALQSLRHLGRQKHVFSHVEWDMEAYEIQLVRAKDIVLQAGEAAEGYLGSTENFSFQSPVIWANPEEVTDKYSIPRAFQRFFLETL